jgi:hypothetical protein
VRGGYYVPYVQMPYQMAVWLVHGVVVWSTWSTWSAVSSVFRRVCDPKEYVALCLTPVQPPPPHRVVREGLATWLMGLGAWELIYYLVYGCGSYLWMLVFFFESSHTHCFLRLSLYFLRNLHILHKKGSLPIVSHFETVF